MPGEEHLLALQERVVEQLKRANMEGLRAQYLKHAQTSIDAGQYDQAIATLETAALDCGQTPETTYLLEYARSEKQNRERSQAAAAVIESAQKRIAADDLEGAVAILRPAAQQMGGVAIETLLRQTQERLDEITRRLDAVVSRVTSLSDSDPEQALQLLASQPAAVQQHSQLKALRTRLDMQAEQKRALREAIAKADELQKKRDLRGGMDALESVRGAYGDSPQLTAAIEEYGRRRGPIAGQMVQESIAGARQAILLKNGPLALEELRKSGDVLEFADEGLRADWTRLAQEASRVAGAKLDTTGTLPILIQKKGLSKAAIGSLVAVLLVVAGVLAFVLYQRSHAPVGGLPLTYLQLNAAPYAEVVSMTGGDGRVFPLPGWRPYDSAADR